VEVQWSRSVGEGCVFVVLGKVGFRAKDCNILFLFP
jgi:hypothetical protein